MPSCFEVLHVGPSAWLVLTQGDLQCCVFVFVSQPALMCYSDSHFFSWLNNRNARANFKPYMVSWAESRWWLGDYVSAVVAQGIVNERF